MHYPWLTSTDYPNLFNGAENNRPVIFTMIGVDTVGKTELSRAIEKFCKAHYYKTKESLVSAIEGAPSVAIVGLFVGAMRDYAYRHRHDGTNIVFDPLDSIQIIARLKAEGKYEQLSSAEILWIEKQSIELMQFLLGEGYDIVSIHLTADPAVTRFRFGVRVHDSIKSTDYDKFLHAHPIAEEIMTKDIAKQVAALEKEMNATNKGQRRVLFVRYDTSNAPGYPTNFDTTELSQFIKYLGEYFGENKLPPIIWTPYSGESESIKWSNDHMTQEIILTTEASLDAVEKRTNWTIPVFQRDGVWCAGFGVDIFDFARSSGELRLKPWGGQSNAGTFDERILHKFQSQSAEIITHSSQLLIPEKKIITPVWHTGGTKELTPYITHLQQDQFENIRSTPRYAQIVAIPIVEIFNTVHVKDGSVDQYIHYNGREYRLAAGSLDMLLLFAGQNNIIKLQ